ncbi:MAG: tetratricopeptide repeat protein [Minisyncoccia bacterium]
MEFELIPQLVIILSIGIVLIILGRKIPKIKDTPGDGFWSDDYNEVEKKEKERFKYLYDRIKKRISKKEYKEKMDLFWIWSEKLLRKIRISFLKFDNKIVQMIGRLREKNIEKVEKISQDAKAGGEGIAKIEDPGNIGKGENGIGDKTKFDWNEMNSKKEEAVVLEKSNISDSIKSEEKIVPEEKVELAEEEAADEKSEDIGSVENDSIGSLSIGDRTNREKKYIDMILKNPIDIKAYWQLGIIYSRRRNYKDAIACFRQITKIDPTYFKAKKKITDLIGRMKKKKNIEGKEEEIEIDGDEEDRN